MNGSALQATLIGDRCSPEIPLDHPGAPHRRTVRGGKMPALDTLMRAITQLVKEELAFTTTSGSDGKTIYIIDSVLLTEEELIFLYNRGALTRNGIRHYLCDRSDLAA
jgi:hypothetical protein